MYFGLNFLMHEYFLLIRCKSIRKHKTVVVFRQLVSRLMAVLQKKCQLLYLRGIPMVPRWAHVTFSPRFSLVTHSKDRIFQRLPPRECFHSRRYFCNSQLSEFSRILSKKQKFLQCFIFLIFLVISNLLWPFSTHLLFFSSHFFINESVWKIIFPHGKIHHM